MGWQAGIASRDRTRTGLLRLDEITSQTMTSMKLIPGIHIRELVPRCNRHAYPALLTVLLCMIPSPARSAAAALPRFAVTHLGDVPNRTNVVGYSRALNNLGQVAGHGYNSFIIDEIAFVWGGQLAYLPTLPNSVLSRAQGINDLGQVVGEIAFSTNDRRATLWEKGGVRVLGGLPDCEVNVAFGINEAGEVVGTSRKLSNPGPTPVLWENGQVLALPLLTGANQGFAFHINDAGQIVGISGPPNNSRAVRWDKGAITDLGTLGGSTSRANAINDLGQIAGFAALANGESHAALWIEGGVLDLGTLGGTNSTAISLNSRRQIVGSARTAANAQRAFLWEDGVMHNLNDLIPADSNWVLQSGEAINELGQISGFGLYQGATRGFLLSPTLGLMIDRAVILSWPTNAVGLTLESAPTVIGPWSPVSPVHTIIGNQYTVALRTTGDASHFRLRQP